MRRVHGAAQECEWLARDAFDSELGRLYEERRSSTEALIEA